MSDDITIRVAKRSPGACAGYTWSKPDEVLDVDLETATVLFKTKDADFYDPGEAEAAPKTTRAKAKADEGSEITED